MFWAFDILKHGVPALIGFLLGLAAVAVIEPSTTDGKVLLIGTVICITMVVYFAVLKISAMMSSGRPDKPDDDA